MKLIEKEFTDYELEQLRLIIYKRIMEDERLKDTVSSILFRGIYDKLK